MSTAAKVGAFFLVVLVIGGLLIWRIEDIRGRKGKSAARRRRVQGRGGPRREIGRARRRGARRKGRADRGRSGDRQGQGRARDRPGASSCARGPSPQIANLGLLGEKYVELYPGPPGAAPLPEGSVLQGATCRSVSTRSRSSPATSRWPDQGDLDQPEPLSGGRRRRRAAEGDRRERARHHRQPARARRIQPRQRRRDAGQLQGILRDDDQARGPHRPARRVEFRQRHAGDRQHPRHFEDARDDGGEPEPDHGQDPVGPGDPRQARAERGDAQEHQRHARLGQGRRQQSEPGGRSGAPDAVRLRRARGVPVQRRPDAGILHPRHHPARQPAVLRARARRRSPTAGAWTPR